MNTLNRTRILLPLLRPLLIGAAVGVVGGTLLLLLAALAIYRLSPPSAAVAAMAVIAIGSAACLGGLTVGLCAGRGGLPLGALCGTLLYLILLIAGLIRGHGISLGYAALKWAVMTVCGAAGGVWGVNRRQL